MLSYNIHLLKSFLEYLNTLGPKWISILGFIIVNTVLIIAIRGCSLHIEKSHSHNEYIASSVVFFTELTKLILSIIISFYEDGNGNWDIFFNKISIAFIDDGLDVLKLCLPAILYAIQNNLQYIIESAPLFIILYQTKIVTTAIFFSVMLYKRIAIKEWCTIIALAVGVGMVESSHVDLLPHRVSDLGGMVAVIIACITSGFAGVYFEKVLKASRSSVWIINIQLSMMSCSFSSIIAMVENAEEIVKFGFFKGFNIFVLLVVLMQAIVGLGIAYMVKFSDNIHKGFGASLSIVFANLIDSYIFNDTTINFKFSLGSILVIGSSLIYFYFTSSKEISHNVPSQIQNHVPEEKLIPLIYPNIDDDDV